MRPYLAILTARLRTLLQYRGAAIGGIGTQLFFGLVRIMILEGFYREATRPVAFTFAQAVGYVWLGWSLWREPAVDSSHRPDRLATA